MKKYGFLIVFGALSLFSVSRPLPAAPQIHVQAGVGSGGVVRIAPVTGGVSASAGVLSNPLTSSGLNSSLGAAIVAPSPLDSSVPAAAPLVPTSAMRAAPALAFAVSPIASHAAHAAPARASAPPPAQFGYAAGERLREIDRAIAAPGASPAASLGALYDFAQAPPAAADAVSPAANRPSELPETFVVGLFAATRFESNGRSFERLTLRLPVDDKDRLSHDVFYAMYVIDCYPFLKQMGFTVKASKKAIVIVRPANARTQNEFIRAYNKGRPKRERISARFWDDFTKQGYAEDENFYSKWATNAAWPIQQRDAGIHNHDQGNHAIPTLALPAEVVDRSRNNFKLLIALRESPLFKDDAGFRNSVNHLLSGTLESGAEFSFDALRRGDLKFMVRSWNGLINSSAQVKRNIPRHYFKGEEGKAIQKTLDHLAPGLTWAEGRDLIKLVERRLQGQ
jgi:hypothetical protein